jgi:hypothetical protein
MSSVGRYLAEIGRRGGIKSRRVLDPQVARHVDADGIRAAVEAARSPNGNGATCRPSRASRATGSIANDCTAGRAGSA